MPPMSIPSGASDTPQGQPRTAPANTTPASEQPDPSGAVSGGPSTLPGHQPAQPGPSGKATVTADKAQDAANKAQSEADARKRDAENIKAHRGVLLEGLSQAHSNHLKAIDGLGQSIARGQQPTIEQVAALRATAVGLQHVIDRLNTEHGVTGEVRVAETMDTPGTAGRPLR